jgi:hypothetical protein
LKKEALVSIIIIALILLAGCGGGGGPLDTAPPTISDIQVNPTQLRFIGGEVTVSAVASDPSGVSKVWMIVQKPEGEKKVVELKLVNSRYEGKYTAEPNLRNDGKEVKYLIWLFAKDANGNETHPPGVPEGGVSFSVLPPISPPQPPPL